MAKKGEKISEYHKEKLRLSNLNRVISNETRLKMSLAKKGKKQTLEHRKKVSLALKGKKRAKLSEDHKAKLRKSHLGQNLGKKLPKEWRDNISKGRLGKPVLSIRGEKHYNWQGGLTSLNKKVRNSCEYRLWRTSVFERDNYTCVFCGVHGVNFHADHIKPFAYYPELRFAIDNGRTLCVDCHKTTETYCKKLKYGIQS